MKPLYMIFISAVMSHAFMFENNLPTEMHASRLSTISSSITDSSRYNTWDHDGIPLGIFEFEKSLISLDLGYRRLAWTNNNNSDSTRTYNGIIAPVIRVGSPGKIYCDLYYSNSPTEISDEGEKPNMALHRFGLRLLTQVEDGRFMFGLTAQGYYGKEKWGANTNQRILMGADDVGLCLGFKLHDAVALNFSGTTSGYVDTLAMDSVITNNENERIPQERFSYFQLPRITIALDIGKDELPYRSNFSVTYGHNSFVYTEKPYLLDIAITGFNEGDDADPLVSDSLAWHWQNLWNIYINDMVAFDPAFELGYWHSRFKHMEPNGDNFPINYKGENPGYEWDTKSFSFGLGGSWRIAKIQRIWLEYAYTTLKLNLTGDKVTSFEVPRNNGYNRLGAGFQTNFNAIPALGMPESFGLYFIFGFLFMQENCLNTTYQSHAFDHLYALYNYQQSDLNVAMDRYQPWEVIKNELNTLAFNFGLGATFLDNTFETAFHLGILRQNFTANRSDTYKGFEIGLDLIFNKFGESGKKTAPSVPSASGIPQPVGN